MAAKNARPLLALGALGAAAITALVAMQFWRRRTKEAAAVELPAEEEALPEVKEVCEEPKCGAECEKPADVAPCHFEVAVALFNRFTLLQEHPNDLVFVESGGEDRVKANRVSAATLEKECDTFWTKVEYGRRGCKSRKPAGCSGGGCSSSILTDPKAHFHDYTDSLAERFDQRSKCRTMPRGTGTRRR